MGGDHRVRISVRHLQKTFAQGAREVAAVADATFDVGEKEFVALIGPSGCGKSTILHMIAGLVAPTGGVALVDGEPVTGPRPQVGYLFQRDTVLPWRTVAKNIALGLEYRWIPAAARQAAVAAMIRTAGLEGFEEAFPATLSGGMRQRVALMRTLVVEPEVLLMDEPFGALDTHTKLDLQRELLDLWWRTKQTVLFVTHDLGEAITLSDRIIVCTRRPGRIKAIFDVDLPRPRDVIALRETGEYARIYQTVWHTLGEEFAASQRGREATRP